MLEYKEENNMKMARYKVSVAQSGCVEVKENIPEVEIVDNNLYKIKSLDNLFNITHAWIMRSMKDEGNLTEKFEHKRFFYSLQNTLIHRDLSKVIEEEDEIFSSVYKNICDCGGFYIEKVDKIERI